MEYIAKSLDELSQKELFDIFKERVRVFVVEQDCPYQEVDDTDETAVHIILKDKDKVAAYARIMEGGDYASFGRVLTVKEYRGLKLGRGIVEKSINEIKERFPGKSIKISAQEYLKSFYESFGFETVSEVYLEDGIPHMDMILKI
ncbi:GNAT family N-acetyltransferase [Corticicoccus populi]|uniref:GNAT family N-acetyltransferase n=1 Tax=Corticicoccus populi TaxID=1812821 RepID=A0ABW5WVU3_9STAP